MAYDPDFDGAAVKRPGWAVERPMGRPPYSLWGWVYLANLPLATFLGFRVAYGPGWIGMASGVAGLYAAGRWMCRVNPRVVRTVSYGGVIVAAAQCIPILQLVAGVLGMAAANMLGQAPFPDQVGSMTLMGGLIATLATGAALIACAWIAGVFVLAVRYAVSPSFRAAVDGEKAAAFKP